MIRSRKRPSELLQAIYTLQILLELVERVPSALDRRITLIACSKKGWLYVEQLKKEMTEYVGFMVNQLTLNEQLLLCESLQTAVSLIQKFQTDDPLPPA